jgi:hypothetical protein
METVVRTVVIDIVVPSGEYCEKFGDQKWCQYLSDDGWFCTCNLHMGGGLLARDSVGVLKAKQCSELKDRRFELSND